MSTARIGSRPALSIETTSTAPPEAPQNHPMFQDPALASMPGMDHPTIEVVKDLVRYARSSELVLADEVLTDILAKLHGWPVDELNRLS